MNGLDERIFGSWILLVVLSLIFGALFSFAASMIQVVTGGSAALTMQSVFVGLLTSGLFFCFLAWVRHRMNEESE